MAVVVRTDQLDPFNDRSTTYPVAPDEGCQVKPTDVVVTDDTETPPGAAGTTVAFVPVVYPEAPDALVARTRK